MLRLSVGKCGGDIYNSSTLINIQIYTHRIVTVYKLLIHVSNSVAYAADNQQHL